MLWTYLGAALLLLAIGLLGLNLFTAIRRMRVEAEQHALDLARFEEELAILRERRRKVAQEPLPWNGFRKFVVSRKVTEGAQVSSLYLTPHDGKPLPAGHFHGISQVMGYGSYVAGVAEVSVSPDGQLKIHKITAATNPGTAAGGTEGASAVANGTKTVACGLASATVR